VAPVIIGSRYYAAVPRRCDQLEAQQLRNMLRGRPATTVARALNDLATAQAVARNSSRPHPGFCLIHLFPSPYSGSGQCVTKSMFLETGVFGSFPTNSGPVAAGLVPDGVRRVTLQSARRYRRAAR
jgi:hypothetical protein